MESIWMTVWKVVKPIALSITAVGVWEVVKFFLPEVKRYLESRKKAKEYFYQNLDPILKVANELYGKLESLAKEDFATFKNQANSNSLDPVHNKKYICFLFAQFWAQMELLRLESQYLSLSKIDKGNELLRFVSTIESRKHRLLDRSIQRIIGECLINQKDQKFRVMTLNEFVIQIDDTQSNLHKWIGWLEKKLIKTKNVEDRQDVLRFGIIVVALINHFDPEHKTVRERTIFTNKLTAKNKNLIRSNLFRQYLPFVKDQSKYY